MSRYKHSISNNKCKSYIKLLLIQKNFWDTRLYDYTRRVQKKKKRPNICYKDFILQHFKHCPLQSCPLYWRYTVPNVSSIVGMLPGTYFLWWRAVLLSHFPESPRVKKKRLNFLNSSRTSIEDALRLPSAPSGRFWQQTAICPVS
jgi:hypothetical protein